MSSQLTNFDADFSPQFLTELVAFRAASKITHMPLVYTDANVAANPIVFANDAFLAMTGFDPEEILGQPIAAIFDDAADPHTISLLQETIAKDEAGTWQFNFQRATESTFPVVVYLTPFHDKKIGIAHNVFTFFDLAALRCLSPKEKDFQPRVYDSAPGFIAYTLGENHVFSYTNASYDDFVQRGNMVGRSVAEALPEIVDQGIIAILDEVYRTGVPFQGSEMPIKIWNPELDALEERWIDAVYQPVRDTSGAIIGLFCEGYDVTKVREANDALTALQSRMIHVSRINAMGTMAATLAHELHQPLSAVANYIAGARPADGENHDLGRLVAALEGIEEASQRAAGIIEQVRQLTRHHKPAEEPFNLKTAVDDSVRLVHTSCSPDSKFVNRVPPELTMVADRIKIQQILINLMLNACQAMAETERPIITIDARQDGNSLIVSVADTGPGITPEADETLFSWTESSKTEGMGLGLSICRTIAEMHGGSIWLEKSGSSQGAKFCFSVPAPSG